MANKTVKVTVKAQHWAPWITPVDVAEATPEQLAAMQVTPSNTKISPYVRTLAHDPESYLARTRLFNAIMYCRGGLGRDERELGALVASGVNGCVYCASVHARRYLELSGRQDVINALYTQGFSARFAPRQQAIIDFCRALSQSADAVTAEQLQPLLAAGLSKAEIVDLIHAAAIFGWANRLMHTLGHATPK